MAGWLRVTRNEAGSADALDSGFLFDRFPAVSWTCFNRAELFDYAWDNALFTLPKGLPGYLSPGARAGLADLSHQRRFA